MLSMNLFCSQTVRRSGSWHGLRRSLALLAITFAGLVPAALRGDEPLADSRSPDIAEAVTQEAPGEPADSAPADSTPALATAAPTAVESGSTKSSPSSALQSAQRRGTAARLPAYFGRVVDDQQRAAIYQIRARAEVQLRQLQQQIDDIRQTEQAEIEALLSVEQLQQIESLRAQRAKSAKSPRAAAPPTANES